MIRRVLCKLALWNLPARTDKIDKFHPERILPTADLFLYFKRVPCERTIFSMVFGDSEERPFMRLI
jgi:hypothetical protein